MAFKTQLSFGPAPMLALAIAAVAFLAPGSRAAAQSTQPGADEGALEEVFVVARRREENLQTTPLSVSAFTSEALERQSIQDLYEIVQRVPGFLVNFDNITEPNLFMRGIGTDIEASAANPSVGIFIDDVYISRAAGALADLWDLERVEVLRGPQSTLFGKNVVGGLVHYVTAKPTREFNSRAELTVGNYQLLGLRGAIGGPLSDRTSAKLSFSSRQHDGYAFNTETQNDMEDLDSATARGHLLFEASDSLEVLLSADFSRRRGTGRWVEITYSPRNAPFVTPDPRSGPSSGPPMGPSGDGRSDVDDGGASVRVTWEGASTTLTSLTAFRDSKVIGEENSAGTSFDFANIEPFVTPESSIPDDFFFQTKVDKARQLSQELRLQSNDSDSAFSWMAGVYYLNEKIDRDEDVTYLFPDIFWSSGTEFVSGNTDGKTYGVFVQGGYDLSDIWNVSGGVRYSRDEKTYDYSHTGTPVSGDYRPGFPNGFTAQADESWSAVTPELTVSVNPSEGMYFYGRVARGYKSGGFAAEGDALSPDEARISFDPEYALNYEVGAKLDLLNRRLRVNPTIFMTKYTDLQTQQLVIIDPMAPPDNVIVNAGGAEAKGVELEITAVPVNGWQVYGNYSYLDCEFTESLIVNGEDQNGNTCRRAPENAFTVGTSFDFAAGSLGDASFDINYRWQDEFYFDNNNDPLTQNDSQDSLDASLSLRSSDGKWEVSLWGKNLTDELTTGGLALLDLPDFSNGFPAVTQTTVFTSYLPPRTYGVTFKWNMGR